MSLAERLVELQRLLDGDAALPISDLWGYQAIGALVQIAIPESRVCKRKRGVFSNGILIVALRLFESRTRARIFVKSPF